MTLLLWVPVRKIAFLTEPIPVLDGPADHTNVNSITIDPTPTNGSLSSTNPNPAGLASLLPSIIKKKLKNFQPAYNCHYHNNHCHPLHYINPLQTRASFPVFSTNLVLPLVPFHPHLHHKAPCQHMYHSRTSRQYCWVSTLSLTHYCQRTLTCLIMIFPGDQFLSRANNQTVPPLSILLIDKRLTINFINKWLSAFAIY